MKSIKYFPVMLLAIVLLVGACAPDYEQDELDINLEGTSEADEVEDDTVEILEDHDEETIDDDLDVVVFEFNAEGFNFLKNGEYNPTITVNEGDRVRIVFTNDDGMPHDWVLDEFDASTRILSRGNSETIEFVADQAGTFEYYCSVGSHRAQGMYGQFVVE